MKACPLSDTYAANTPIWQLVILPAEPVYWRPTPHEAWPCLRKPVSSMTSTASGSARVSSASSRTRARSASASHRLRSRSACWRQGPGSPAASARIHPVLRRSGPSRASRNSPAAAAVRSCRNTGLIRSLMVRNEDAHSSSVASTEPPVIHDLRTMVTQMAISRRNHNCNARLRFAFEDARDHFAALAEIRDDGTYVIPENEYHAGLKIIGTLVEEDQFTDHESLTLVRVALENYLDALDESFPLKRRYLAVLLAQIDAVEDSYLTCV